MKKKKAILIILIIVIIVSVILCFCSFDSEEFPEAELGKYKIDEYSSFLEEVKEKYEITEISGEGDGKILDPINEIETPKYEADEYGVYHTDEDGGKYATLMITGDLMCRAQQQESANSNDGTYNFEDSFSALEHILERCDFLAGNLETTLSESAKYTYEEEYTDGNLNRNAPSTYLDTLKSVGFDFLCTANNHCLDAGITGIYETNCHLDQYGFIHTGTFMNAMDRDQNAYKIVEISGIKVGFITYSNTFNHHDDNLTAEGSEVLLNKYSKEKAEKDIAAAKEAGAEYIIVYMHWGTENTHVVNDTQRQQAQELADAGADFIAGSHPHVIQPFTRITSSSGKTVRVIYSLGNFISSMDASEQRESVIIKLQLHRVNGEVEVYSCRYIPCYAAKKFNGREWTVLPLIDFYTNQSENLQAAKNRIVYYIGSEIKLTTVDYNKEQ